MATPATRKVYNSLAHREAQRRAKRNPLCTCCGRCGRLIADHIKPLKDGGKSEEENYQFLCKKCNGLKTARENRKRVSPERREWKQLVINREVLPC